MTWRLFFWFSVFVLYPVLWMTVLRKFCTGVLMTNLMLLVKWWCKYLFSYKYKIVTNLITLSACSFFPTNALWFARLRQADTNRREKGKRGNEFLFPVAPGINKPAGHVGTPHNTTTITHSLPFGPVKNGRGRLIRRNEQLGHFLREEAVSADGQASDKAVLGQRRGSKHTYSDA